MKNISESLFKRKQELDKQLDSLENDIDKFCDNLISTYNIITLDDLRKYAHLIPESVTKILLFKKYITKMKQ